MPDQDRQTGWVGEPSGSEGSEPLTVPVGVVDWLREGAYAMIGSAAEAINESVFANGRGGHPEWFRGPAGHLCGVFALLDAVGWSSTDPPADVRVDLRKHGRVMLGALRIAVRVADDDLREAMQVDAERATRDEPPQRKTTTRRVLALREFVAAVEDQANP